MKKYELTTDTIFVSGKTLVRIRALIDFGAVKAGDLGGYVEGEHNLGHLGLCWVHDNVSVYGDANVYGNANVSSIDDFIAVGPAKSSGRTTVAFKDSKIGIRVVCGCFSGTTDEFIEQIEKTHANDSDYLRQYRLFHQLIVYNFQQNKE